MTAITKMFLSSSYSLSKNSHPCCVVFKMGYVLIEVLQRNPCPGSIKRRAISGPRRGHEVTRWRHLAILLLPTLCKISREMVVMHESDFGVP